MLSSNLVRFTMSAVVQSRESYPTSSIVRSILLPTRFDFVNVIPLSPRLKSKYLSMPDDYELNDLAKSKYPVIYQGFGHIIYLIH